MTGLSGSGLQGEDADRVTVNGVSSEDQCIGANGEESGRHDCQSVAEVRGELLQLRPGDYSLVSDQDPSIRETQLHLLLHFCCERELLSQSQSISSLSLSIHCNLCQSETSG